jgi:hypothetical protein
LEEGLEELDTLEDELFELEDDELPALDKEDMLLYGAELLLDAEL